MGAAATVANVPQILKNIWQDDIFNFMYSEQPHYGLLTKDTGWDGLSQLITVQYGGVAGVSSVFEKAKVDKTPPKFAQMTIKTNDLFGLWSVDHKLITLSRNQRGALVRALVNSTETAMTKLKRRTCQLLWRNGGGSFGAISALSTTTLTNDTITLKDINDVRGFDVDDVLEFSLDDGYYASAGVLGGTAKVLSIDEDAGKLVCDIALGNIAGLTTGAFIFHEGDYNNVFKGWPAYVTLNKPGASDAFGSGTEPSSIWGMTTTTFPTRLAGSRFTGSNLMVAESIKKALATASRRSIKTTHLFMSPEVFNDLEMSLQGQKRYVDEKTGTVGYTALEFTTQSGKMVKAYADADIPKTRDGLSKVVWGVNLDQAKFHTADEFPMWLANVAGRADKFMTEQNANATEGRLGGYGQFYTDAPGQSWNLTFT